MSVSQLRGTEPFRHVVLDINSHKLDQYIECANVKLQWVGTKFIYDTISDLQFVISMSYHLLISYWFVETINVMAFLRMGLPASCSYNIPWEMFTYHLLYIFSMSCIILYLVEVLLFLSCNGSKVFLSDLQVLNELCVSQGSAWVLKRGDGNPK